MNSGFGIFMVLLIGLGLFLFYKFVYSKFKHPKCKALTFITGGVKSGKTAFTISLALKNYKSALRYWRFKSFFQKLLHREVDEKPLLYSNVPLTCDYVPLTTKLLLREERFNFKSVVIISEGSLVADSQLIKDSNLNNRLLLFFKLFGHETHGGKCFIESQSISDVHYSIKRSISEYFYIHNTTRLLFGTVFSIREHRYSEGGEIMNVFDKDLEEDLKKVWVSSKVWKKFDTYSLSCHTDKLKNNDRSINSGHYLKQTKVVSFRDFFNSLDCSNEVKKNEKENVSNIN